MRTCVWLQHLLVLLSLSGVVLLAPIGRRQAAAISRDDFPAGFIFGAGTSAYQVEGAAAEDGRSPSIWDTFTHAGRTMDRSSGDIAADQYHKFKEDVKLMHDMGLDAYRFSISWSRLIPNGRGPVNPKGLRYYNDLIHELRRYGIEPHVTLLHFDLPQALEEEYGGLLSPKIVDDFTAYADVCFGEFGDRVKYWITFNEPNVQPVLGNDVGIFAPGRCSLPYAFLNCSPGNSSTEPYIAAHNLLRAHASAVSLYKHKYQATQGGSIGITLLAMWFEPSTDSPEDVQAQKRALDFHIGWFMEPILYGNYPRVMEKIVGARLPSFREEESKMLKGSFDFVGLNHYGAIFLQAAPTNLERDYLTDLGVLPARTVQFVKDFRGPSPMPATPWALQRLLEYMKVTYGNPPIMIHENGYGEFNMDLTSNALEYADDARATMIEKYLHGLLLSVRNGSNTQGYFVWSLVDCFELSFGYKSRYGLIGVDFSSENRTRYPRYSAKWYSNFLHANGLSSGASVNMQQKVQ